MDMVDMIINPIVSSWITPLDDLNCEDLTLKIQERAAIPHRDFMVDHWIKLECFK
jgi:hypothetical protein